MKKILFAITGLRGGGAERVVSVWASPLAEKGYEVGILTFAKKRAMNTKKLNSKQKYDEIRGTCPEWFLQNN